MIIPGHNLDPDNPIQFIRDGRSVSTLGLACNSSHSTPRKKPSLAFGFVSTDVRNAVHQDQFPRAGRIITLEINKVLELLSLGQFI